MSSHAFHRFLSLIVLVALVLQPVPATAAQTPRVPDAPAAADAMRPGFLFRAAVELAGSRNLARLEKTGVLVLRSFTEGEQHKALVLADALQLADLARLGFRPQAADELRGLLQAQGREKRWLAESLAPLLAQADALAAPLAAAAAVGEAATPDAAALQTLRAGVKAMTVEQMAGTADSVSVDDDADGLTNTQESWWCTDLQDPDTDDDGRTDGAEIQALKDWLGNKRESAPGETPWPNWPPQRTNCPDKDNDSIPNLAERWDLGLNMDLESSDRDKFDDGQELFGITYCPGGDNNCGYGDLPRSSDAGYVGAQMPSWVKAPGKSPLVAAFPVPQLDVVVSSLHVETVTEVTTDHVISEGTEKSYSTATMEGASTSHSDTETWSDWQEVTISHTDPSASPSTAQFSTFDKQLAVNSRGLSNLLKGEASFEGVAQMQGQAGGAASGCGLSLACAAGSINNQIQATVGKIENKLEGSFVKLENSTLSTSLVNLKDSFSGWLNDNNLFSNISVCSGGCLNNIQFPSLTITNPFNRHDNSQDRFVSGSSFNVSVDSSGQANNVQYQRLYPVVIERSVAPMLSTTTTSQSTASSRGGARTTTTEQYEEHTVTNGEAFSTEEAWGTATAVNSAHAADLWFTYKVRNVGTEYACEIADLAFNVYIGDDPSPVYTYFVAPDLGGDGKFHNFMPGEEHTYTAQHIPLTLDQMETVDLGRPIRIVVEDFTYGVDELFYQDAANAGVLLAMEDGTADGDEAIDTYLIPTWGEETVLDVLGRYFPHDTDADGMVTAVWTPEYRADTPAWCDAPSRTGNTLWCRHALSTADWWNIYTNGMGDGTEGFQDTPAAAGQVALFRFNTDSDLDGYSDRSEARLGTDPADPSSFPKPELLAGVHSITNGNMVTATLSLLNTGVYDAYGVEAVMIAPDDSISITNNTVGGSGRVRAQKQVIVGSRILAQDPLPSAWTQAGHAKPAAGGYYTGNVDRTYTFTVQSCAAGGCDVGTGTWVLHWDDGQGASGDLPFAAGYQSPTFLDVGTLGLKLALYTGTVNNGESFTVAANTPRDTFQYTIASGHESNYTPPIVLVSYNDPQGNHRFVTPVTLTSPTDDLTVHSGKMQDAGAEVEIVTTDAFDAAGENTTNLVLQAPAAHMTDAHAFLEFVDPDGNVVREEAVTQSLDAGPNVVPVTWNPANFNPPYDPAKDYIVIAFFTDWQGNILDTAARPLSSFQVDPKPVLAFDPASTTWNFGSVAQGDILQHAFTVGNTGQMDLRAAVAGTGARADQTIPGNPSWIDTGIDVAVGDALGIRASGSVCYGSGGTTCYGPDGSGSTADSTFTLPGAPAYSLIGRIGAGTAFAVSGTYVGTAGSGGRLYLGTNDITTGYANNTGGYKTHIEVQGLPHSQSSQFGFSVGPADTAVVTVTLDTYYLPAGPFDRSLTLRTSDPDHPSRSLRVQGTVQPYVTPARATAITPYRPWDEKAIVAGDKSARALVTFTDRVGIDAAAVQPLWVYDDARTIRLGSGKEVATLTASGSGLPQAASTDVGESAATLSSRAGFAAPVAINGLEDMFGDGRDGVMPGSGSLNDDHGFGLGSVNATAGSTSLSVTDQHSVWRIKAGDRVLIHQTRGSGAGNWELKTAASAYSGGGLSITSPLMYSYVTNPGTERAQILRVPQYTDCPASGALAPLTAWNGNVGGIFAIMCSGTLSGAGTFTANGGNGWVSRGDQQGGGTGGGFRGGNNSADNSGAWTGEGHVGTFNTESTNNNGNGGGGGGGYDYGLNDGAGGGNGTSGGNGSAGYPTRVLGGIAVGNPELTSVFLGGGGGGGRCDTGGDGGAAGGGSGGGIILLLARTVQLSGIISAQGGSGGDGCADGGGGAGGSVLIRAANAALGTGLVTATGGNGPNTAGEGGSGRIRVEFCDTMSGSTNPGASAQKLTCYGIVTGKVWSDNNNNGSIDAGEPAMANVGVTLSGVGTTPTGADGTYTFQNVVPGSYTVSVTPPAGYVNTTPGSVGTMVASNSTSTVNFGLLPRGSIGGRVFHDANNNLSQDAGEPGIAGVTVKLNGGEQTRTTASDGSYSFADLMPAMYTVAVTVPDGYVNTTDTQKSASVSAGTNDIVNFGLLIYTVEKVPGSDHDSRLFVPESFKGGRRYWVQYGRTLGYTASGSLRSEVEVPQVHYGAASLDLFIAAPTGSSLFVQVSLDVGCDSSQEWSVNGNYTLPQTFSTAELALGFNRFLSTLATDPDGLVSVPLCVSYNQAGRIYLTNLRLTPDGISDESISPPDISFGAADPVEGDTVSVEAVLHNPSARASGSLMASFYATNPTWGEWYIGSAFVPDVPAGGTTTAQIIWNTLGFTGTVPVRVSIDPYNRIAETNENNNTASTTKVIKTRPDLRVAQLALSDDEPMAGETITATLMLRNDGQTPAAESRVALYDGNPESGGVLLGEALVPVGAEASAAVEVVWKPAAAGPRQLFARADAGRIIKEYDEGNNDTWRDVHVGFASPLLIDSGGGASFDPAYTPELGFGHQGGEESTFCGSDVTSSVRKDYSARVQYRFDHLLPGHFYHLDLVLLDCDGGGRLEQVRVDDNVISDPIDLSDGALRRLSFRLDPALYADRGITVSIEELYGADAVVSEINLFDIDYRYADAGASSEPPYSASRGYGYLDGVLQSPPPWGTLPYQTRRIDGSDSNPDDDPDNELRYRFDRLDKNKKYQLWLKLYQGAGTATINESISVDSVDTGQVLQVTGVAQDEKIVDVPVGMYASDGTITVRIIRQGAAANAWINEIALEELTLAPPDCTEVAVKQVIPLHSDTDGPNWFSFNIKPPVQPPAACSGVSATSAFTTIYGDSMLAGTVAPVGSIVEAFTPGGVKTGCFKLTEAGLYGYMRVYGAEGATPGMQPGDPIVIKINGIAATTTPYPLTWQDDKATHEVDLDAPDVVPVEALLSAVSGQFTKLQCESGTYLPPPADPRFNTCTTVAPGQSYLLWMNGAANLTVSGCPVAQDKPVALHAGYNWLGNLPTCELAVATALESIAGKYDIVHSEDGTYRPPPANPAYNTLNTLAPGRGYMIHMTEAATLTYPADLCGGALTTGAATEPAGSCAAQPTSRFSHYYGQVDAPAGSEVLAYSPSGQVVGCGRIGEAGLLPYLRVYGQEGNVPGMEEGEPVELSVDGRTFVTGAGWRNDWGVHPLQVARYEHRGYFPLLLYP